MVKVNDFFIAQNTVGYMAEEAYQELDLLTGAVAAVSQMMYQSLYVIDYYKKNFLYVSNNPLFLCGNTAEEVKNMGYQHYIRNVPEKEQEMLVEINRAGFDFFNKIPVNERRDYAIIYDFHLLKGLKKTLVNHQITPLLLTETGKVWLAVCFVSLSSHDRAGNIIMRKTGQPDFWEYSLDGHKWHKKSGVKLKEREREILTLSAQGYTVNEIAEKLCLSPDTIKVNKKKLFEKLEVDNIVEALFFTTNYRLF